MTLNINQKEYVTEAGDTAGAVVVIRPQNQMPFPEDDGTIVSPGHATSIAITQVNDNNQQSSHRERAWLCIYTVLPEKVYDTTFNDKFNSICPIPAIFGTNYY